MQAKTIKNMLFSGEIPTELEEKANCIALLMEYEATIPSMVSVLLASARRDNFKDDIIGWVKWAGNTFGYSGSYLHHRHKCGKLLLDMMSVNDSIYKRLLALDCEKLLAISRLPIENVEKFVKAYPPENESREKVRRCVAFCLGEVDSPELPEESEKPKSGKYQPTLWDSLDALIGKKARDYEDIAVSKDFNAARAHQCAMGSLGMLTASTTYWKTHEPPEDKILEAIEKELRKEADMLKELRENTSSPLLNVS